MYQIRKWNNYPRESFPYKEQKFETIKHAEDCCKEKTPFKNKVTVTPESHQHPCLEIWEYKPLKNTGIFFVKE